MTFPVVSAASDQRLLSGNPSGCAFLISPLRAEASMTRTGILLINLGTPDAPTPEAVGRYLREFLMDGFVIDVPKPVRWFLVNIVIVPRRKTQSARAYQKVQLPEGSPLLVYTRDFAEKVRAQLASVGDKYVVEYAMRYGNPSIKSALERLRA